MVRAPAASVSTDSKLFKKYERFSVLLPALSKQLDLGPMEQGDEYFERMEQVIPCLGAFPRAMENPMLLKELNEQVLYKLQDSSSHVRKCGLMVLGEFYKRMGDEFFTFLPDTVPLLVELLEDDSEEVEKQSQLLVASIEAILGEPLSNYY